MGYNSMLKTPKKEEQQVPDASTASEFDDTKGSYAHGEIDIIEELEGILGVENEDLSGDKAVKTEHLGFWEVDDEKRVSLNLNLNYQDVLDAWSDRGPLWADDYSISTATNGNAYYMGEVPMMELEERTRREASVLRYKEKRQSRLFCKKIRYQVRKLNADKRPRLKGRFVKRVS
ncbi:hypothetical protein GOBAR_DD35140 [Gossypium barbadense]|nr:hypothetical protein GOBAR_DD35140 [Gossypium barbadense]